MPALPATASARASAAERRLHAGILGCGGYAPAAVISNADLEAMVATSDAWITERTGIQERRRVGPGETAASLAAEAGRRALAAAGTTRVDALIVATCSAHVPVPPTACLVQRDLGLDEIPAFDLNAACSGFVYGLQVADSLIARGGGGTVLVVGVDALTPLVDYTDRATCVLFGDAAGAAVVGGVGEGGIEAATWGADGHGAEVIYYGHKPDQPDSAPGLRMAGRGTYRLAVERMVQMARELCAEAGWAPEEVDVVVPHQANLRIIEATMSRLGIPLERAVVNIQRYGNTSAASIPMALAEAVASGRLHHGQRVLMIAFGAGITWAGLAMRWTEPAR